MSATHLFLGILIVALAAIITLVIALAMTLRARRRRHSFSWQRSPSAVDPKRSPQRSAVEVPQRAEAANPTASAPGFGSDEALAWFDAQVFPSTELSDR